MVDLKVGNVNKKINNSVFAQVKTSSVDYEYWYSEIYGMLPVYKCEYNLTRENDRELRKTYGNIFRDLVNSGEFVAIECVYGNRSKSDEWDEGEDLNSNFIVNNFCIASADENEPLFIVFSYGSLTIMTHLGEKKIADTIDRYIKKYDDDGDKIKAYIIVKNMDMYLNGFDIKLKGDLDLDMYNDGFENVHNEMVRSLKEDENGIYLLYGQPGSGKTTYIRYLIKECSNYKRKFVYIPSELVEELTGPNFLSFLIEHKGCIFILEDCEDLVTVTDGVRSGLISNLLNMTDGLLADALNIKFICTFNTDEGEIDKALLRPGRCRTKYKFELLDKDRANKVAKKLGLEEVDKDISLAELFNRNNNFIGEKKETKKIGFRND